MEAIWGLLFFITNTSMPLDSGVMIQHSEHSKPHGRGVRLPSMRKNSQKCCVEAEQIGFGFVPLVRTPTRGKKSLVEGTDVERVQQC